jgi:hypothetical protein
MTRNWKWYFGAAVVRFTGSFLLALAPVLCVGCVSSWSDNCSKDVRGIRLLSFVDLSALRKQVGPCAEPLCLIEGRLSRWGRTLCVDVPLSSVVSLFRDPPGLGGRHLRILLSNASSLGGFRSEFTPDVDIIGTCPFIAPSTGRQPEDAAYEVIVLGHFVTNVTFDCDASIWVEVLEIRSVGRIHQASDLRQKIKLSGYERSMALAAGTWGDFSSIHLEEILGQLTAEEDAARRLWGIQNVLFAAIRSGYWWIAMSIIESLEEEPGAVAQLANLSPQALLFLKGSALRRAGLLPEAECAFSRLLGSAPTSAWASLFAYLDDSYDSLGDRFVPCAARPVEEMETPLEYLPMLPEDAPPDPR